MGWRLEPWLHRRRRIRRRVFFLHIAGRLPPAGRYDLVERGRCGLARATGDSGHAGRFERPSNRLLLGLGTIAFVAEPQTISLDEQLKEIGAQLAWVRDYL